MSDGGGRNPGAGGRSDTEEEAPEAPPPQIQRQMTPAPRSGAGEGTSGGHYLEIGDFPDIFDQYGQAVGSTSYGVSYHIPDQNAAILKDDWREFNDRIERNTRIDQVDALAEIEGNAQNAQNAQNVQNAQNAQNAQIGEVPVRAPRSGGRVPRANLAPLSLHWQPPVVRRRRTRWGSVTALLWGPNAAPHVVEPIVVDDDEEGEQDAQDNVEDAEDPANAQNVHDAGLVMPGLGVPELNIFADLPDVALADYDVDVFFPDE